MKIINYLKGKYYNLKSRFSLGSDREKYLILSTNLLMKSKGATFRGVFEISQKSYSILDLHAERSCYIEYIYLREPEFNCEIGLGKTARKSQAKKMYKPESFPSKDGFADNICLFFTAPDK